DRACAVRAGRGVGDQLPGTGVAPDADVRGLRAHGRAAGRPRRRGAHAALRGDSKGRRRGALLDDGAGARPGGVAGPPMSAMDARIAEPLAGAGIRVLYLSGGAPAPVEVMVRRRDAGTARRALEGTDWRLALGDAGMWRVTRASTYLWADGLGLRLLWGVP